MAERGLYRDIDMSCHVSQGTRADEHLLDEGVRAGKRRIEPRRRDFACTHARRRNRSEERRVGKECRCRWSTDHSKEQQVSYMSSWEWRETTSIAERSWR